MVNYREILRLHSLGQSQRTIRSSAHCSDNTVRTVLEVASQKGIQWPLDDDITNADLERMLFPDKYKSACLYIEPDYPYIHRELAKHGVSVSHFCLCAVQPWQRRPGTVLSPARSPGGCSPLSRRSGSLRWSVPNDAARF